VLGRLSSYIVNEFLFVAVFCSESHVQERKQLTESLELIHDILSDINQRVDARQKQQRLSEICRRLDAKAFTLYRGEKFKVACPSVLDHT